MNYKNAKYSHYQNGGLKIPDGSTKPGTSLRDKHHKKQKPEDKTILLLLFDVVELAKSPQPRPEIARDIMFTVGLKVQACIGIRASKYFGRNLVFIRRKRREKRVGRFLYFPPHSSILISSETKTELASHTLDYGQASVDDDVYKV